MIKLILPYPVSSNVYWRSRVVTPKQGKPFVSVYVSEDAKAYKEEVALIARHCKPMDGALGYRLKIFRPRKVGDLSNRVKVLEDALNGIAYHDDKQISKTETERFDDAKHPRVEIEIYSREGLLFQ